MSDQNKPLILADLSWPEVEAVWTAVSDRDFDEFKGRLPAHLRRLDALGINYRPLG